MRDVQTDVETSDVAVEMKDAIGDRDLNVLVRRYSPLVLATCMKITGNRHDAEDAAQAVFLCLALQLRGGRRIRAMGPWLHRVASHASIDICRRRKRRKNREDVYARAVEADASELCGGPPADQEELRGTMQLALGELPAKYRLPLILHYFGGLTHAELSKELGCTRSTLRVRMHRGHKLLREGLRRHGVELTQTAIVGFLAAAVKWQVADSLLTGMVAGGSRARQLGLHAVGASPDVTAIACGALTPRLMRVKFLMWLGLAATGLAAAGSSLWAKLREEVRDWPEVPSIRDAGEKLIPTFSVPKLPLLKLPLTQAPAGGDRAVGDSTIASHGTLGNSPASLATLRPAPFADVVLARPERHRQGPAVDSIARTMGWESPYSACANIAKSAMPMSALPPLIHGPGAPAPGYVMPVPFAGAKIEANDSAFARGRASFFTHGVTPSQPSPVTPNFQVSKPGGGSENQLSSVDPPSGVSVGQPGGIAPSTPTKPPVVNVQITPPAPEKVSPRKDRRAPTVYPGQWLAQSGLFTIVPGMNLRVAYCSDGSPAGESPGDALLTPMLLNSRDLPEFPAGHRLLNAWVVSQRNVPDCGFDLGADYSDQALINSGFDERYLKLWYFDAGWHRVTDESFFRDNQANRLGGHIPDGSSFVVISTPEPTIISLGVAIAAAMLLRRRSRK